MPVGNEKSIPINENLEKAAQDIIETHLTSEFEIDRTTFKIITAIRYDPMLYTGLLPIDFAGSQDLLDTSFFYLFSNHVERLNDSLEFFNSVNESEVKPDSESNFKSKFMLTPESLQLELSSALKDINRFIPYKLRVLIDHNNILQVEPVPVTGFFNSEVIPNLKIDIPIIEQWQNELFQLGHHEAPVVKLYLDSEPTPISPFTSFKTTKRDHYNAARARKVPAGALPSEADVLLFNVTEQVTESSISNIAVQRTVKHPITGVESVRWITPTLATGCLNGVVRRELIRKELIFEGLVPVKQLKNGEHVLLMNGIRGVMLGTLII
ncbi:unnamed protein product [Ambrosiozyma monospora]|uniref:Unnamed protein product n=1 Tax=Ambrosiozyma monospora TaxID=43982 RepID=A0A9W6YNW3_AMBMO|nr:unnamed protein product [Ambrosiozyma monospora]